MVDDTDLPDLEALSHRPRQSRPAETIDLEHIHARALHAARAAVDVKAEDVRVLDMHEVVSYTDYLVLCTGRNTRLTRRIMEEVAFKVKQEYGINVDSTEGSGSGEWILLDYLDFIVHIFTPEARDFYRLDNLWKQAPVEVIS